MTRFYNLVEETVVLIKKKKAFKTKEKKQDKRGNRIPKNIQILMRMKTSISKKILSSNSSKKTLRMMKTLASI